MVDPRRYGPQKRRQHAVRLDVRLRRVTDGPAPTKREVRDVLMGIAESGQVPPGWQVAAVDWAHPSRVATEWRQGDVSDLTNMVALVVSQLDRATIGVEPR